MIEIKLSQNFHYIHSHNFICQDTHPHPLLQEQEPNRHCSLLLHQTLTWEWRPARHDDLESLAYVKYAVHGQFTKSVTILTNAHHRFISIDSCRELSCHTSYALIDPPPIIYVTDA
jgi:hypothetical protein